MGRAYRKRSIDEHGQPRLSHSSEGRAELTIFMSDHAALYESVGQQEEMMQTGYARLTAATSKSLAWSITQEGVPSGNVTMTDLRDLAASASGRRASRAVRRNFIVAGQYEEV